MKENSKRFIDAFNAIDRYLRTTYSIKRSMNFAEMVRRCVNLNPIIRKYEEDIIDYGRLRNAIIHYSDPDKTIAEPHDDITEKIEHIAEILSVPPTVLDNIDRQGVLIAEHNVSVKEIIKLITKSSFSNIPIYKDGTLIGVANSKKIMEHLGQVLNQGFSLDKYITDNKIEYILPKIQEKYYLIKDQSLKIGEALDIFYTNRKLLLILITKTGGINEPPLGVLTATDMIALNNILENY